MNEGRFGQFQIPGHSTKRQWSVYIIVGTHKEEPDAKVVYVGKTGDNRSGCNPIISRVGNHFSYTHGHSQVRRKIEDAKDKDEQPLGYQACDFDFEYHYCHFGVYDDENENVDEKGKTNELERELNRKVQKAIENKLNLILLNPYKGVGVSKQLKEKRAALLDKEDKNVLGQLLKQAKIGM